MTDRQDMEAILEAILFVSHDPVSRDRLLANFDEREQEEAGAALDALVERYREKDAHGIILDEVAGGLRLVTRPDLHGYLKRFFEVSGRNKMTMAALETLSIIAYRQPVTGPEIQELRSVNPSGVLKSLLERRLIRIVGRKEVVGKPFLYGTTREFLMHFGLRGLKELPPLEQFEEMLAAEAADEDLEPDAEEQVDREASELEDAELDAVAAEERERIEQERADAEALAEGIDEPEEEEDGEAPETSDEEKPVEGEAGIEEDEEGDEDDEDEDDEDEESPTDDQDDDEPVVDEEPDEDDEPDDPAEEEA